MIGERPAPRSGASLLGMAGRGVGATRRIVRRVSEAESGRTLADVLGDALAAATGEGVPRSRVRAMIAAGAVHVNGRPLRVAARPLRAGQRVETLARLEDLRPPTRSTDRPFRLGPESVLYRDRWLVAVAKPAGLPTHATVDPHRASLAGHVQRLVDAASETVAVHQRLDRDTSGVVLFGLAAEANAGLARAFAGAGRREDLPGPHRPALGAAAARARGRRAARRRRSGAPAGARRRRRAPCPRRPASPSARCSATPSSSRRGHARAASTRCARTSPTPGCRCSATRSTATAGSGARGSCSTRRASRSRTPSPAARSSSTVPFRPTSPGSSRASGRLVVDDVASARRGRRRAATAPPAWASRGPRRGRRGTRAGATRSRRSSRGAGCRPGSPRAGCSSARAGERA